MIKQDGDLIVFDIRDEKTAIRLDHIQATMTRETDLLEHAQIVIRLFGDEVTAKTTTVIYINYGKNFSQRDAEHRDLLAYWRYYIAETKVKERQDRRRTK